MATLSAELMVNNYILSLLLLKLDDFENIMLTCRFHILIKNSSEHHRGFIALSFLCSLDSTGKEAKVEVHCLTHQLDIKRIPLEV